MKTVARWVSLFVFVVVVCQWWDGARSWGLLAVGGVAALVLFWSCGAFSRAVWFGSPEVDAECVRVDAELDALERTYPATGRVSEVA